jgi:acyl-coenzyme A synthetase/AMP-(fatty) acid ligase/acyl carrier protein
VQLGETLLRHEVTTLWLTASLFNAVVDEAAQILYGVNQLIVGGEPLSPSHVRRALDSLPDTKLVNGYGPTESTTFACCYHIPRDLPPDAVSIPIGRPIANTKAYILDSNLKPVPVGVTGELFLGGDGLARGYWNRPELTAEKFIIHSFKRGSRTRVYRTGDFVRYLPDGNIEFQGRRDQQVKLRGFRIELGEIEAVLQQHAAVQEAAVLVREDRPGDQRLVAYVVNKHDPGPGTEDLWEFLKQKLPGHMVPGTFIFLPALPRNANGKLNRRGLPSPGEDRPALEQYYEPPRTPLEDAVAQIWRSVLKLEQVGVHDNFFELGGHSLTAMQVISRLRTAYSINISWSTLFDHPTAAGLAESIQHLLPQHRSG